MSENEKLTQEELVKWLTKKILSLPISFLWNKYDEKGYQQLKEIVEGHFKEQGLPEKRALTIEEVIQKYPEQVKKMLREKSTVSNKKIEDMASQIACDYPDVVFPNLIPIVRNIAKEFGLEVGDE